MLRGDGKKGMIRVISFVRPNVKGCVCGGWLVVSFANATANV